MLNVSSEIKNIKQDLINFREDVLYKVDANEFNTTCQYNNLKEIIDKKITDFEFLITTFSTKMLQFQENNISDKLKIEKIDDLLKFKDNANDTLFNINLKLITLSNNYNNSCDKYDKIFLQNLQVPGIVGDFAKYKNLKEFVEVLFFIYLSFF